MAKFVPVVSSSLTAMKYQRESGRLVVQFGEGVYYEYDEVPSDVVLDVMFADSVGQSFAGKVKKGGFTYRRIPSADANV